MRQPDWRQVLGGEASDQTGSTYAVCRGWELTLSVMQMQVTCDEHGVDMAGSYQVQPWQNDILRWSILACPH
jgi:hypothetical protein